MGAVTEFSYDDRGNLVETRLPTVTAGTAVSTIAYNGRGQPISTRDAAGWETALSYDNRGNLVRTVSGVGVENWQTDFTYNDFGDLTSQTNALGDTTKMEYDEMRRLVRRVYAQEL